GPDPLGRRLAEGGPGEAAAGGPRRQGGRGGIAKGRARRPGRSGRCGGAMWLVQRGADGGTVGGDARRARGAAEDRRPRRGRSTPGLGRRPLTAGRAMRRSNTMRGAAEDHGLARGRSALVLGGASARRWSWTARKPGESAKALGLGAGGADGGALGGGAQPLCRA